jgi:tetratricopeptide (TPR) repeat protein
MKRGALVLLLVFVAVLVAFVTWQGVMREREFRRLMAEGDRALAADQTFPAVEAFSGAIALKPESMIAHLKRGETYRRRGETGAALRDLRTASRLDPAATKPLELLGDVNAGMERYANAAESYEAYVRLDDRSPRVLYKLGLARYRLGQPQAAVASLNLAVSLDDVRPGVFTRTDLAAAHYLRGLCLRALNQLPEAAGSFDAAIKLDAALAAAREELADVYTALHRDKEAATQLEALAAFEPGRVERHVALALAYARSGQHELAVLTLRRAAADRPESNDLFTAIGRIWLEVAEAQRDRVAVNKALEALLPAVRRGPATSEALLLLGRAQMLAGDPGSAERSFRQATVTFPVEPPAFLQLSQAAERNGHTATARDALARYTALTGDGTPPVERAIHLGDLSLRLNEPAAAAAWYGRATENAAAGAHAYVRLAEVRLRLQDVPGASDAVAHGLVVDPKNQQLLALQRQLARPR